MCGRVEVHMRVNMAVISVCVLYMCLCVWEREREREGEGIKGLMQNFDGDAQISKINKKQYETKEDEF